MPLIHAKEPNHLDTKWYTDMATLGLSKQPEEITAEDLVLVQSLVYQIGYRLRMPKTDPQDPDRFMRRRDRRYSLLERKVIPALAKIRHSA